MSRYLTVGEFVITVTDDDPPGIILRGNGENRAISNEELQQLCEEDGPVTIR